MRGYQGLPDFCQEHMGEEVLLNKRKTKEAELLGRESSI